jgi:catechol 2,3-dioxygenase-like lactoylglutathione lyase family enzyme
MKPQPLIAVRDVEASSRWYQTLLGCLGDHGGPEYERLKDRDGTLIMQLHHWGVEHHHGEIGDPTQPPGNGVLIWFAIEDFEAAVVRSVELDAEIVMSEHRNPPEGEPGGPAHHELWIKDLDGYTVVLASPDGSDPLP